jgi:hypothetical protein
MPDKYIHDVTYLLKVKEFISSVEITGTIYYEDIPNLIKTLDKIYNKFEATK